MQQAIEALLADQSWYRLHIPAEELTGNSFEKVRLWEEIAISLLKKYTDRYYTFRKWRRRSNNRPQSGGLKPPTAAV